VRVGVCGAKRRIDQRVKAFLDRPIEGDWPYLWIDATYVKVRQEGRILSVAVIVAVGVNADGRREILGLDVGHSEAETFWTGFLRKLARRGLRGAKLVISDGHEGIKATVSKILTASWQRCRARFMRNVLAHAGRSCRRVVSAFIATAFARDQATHRCGRHLSNEDAIVRLVGAILLEQNGEWAVQRAGNITLESIAPISAMIPLSGCPM
jgi:transposase-like protein